jgi:hypothetical protein
VFDIQHKKLLKLTRQVQLHFGETGFFILLKFCHNPLVVAWFKENQGG